MSELVGRKLGKYTLESSLGEGGMAAVFRSHHPQFDRPVAIKILPPTVGQDAGFRARFEREGRTIAGLNHPNIIRVYDIDEADGLFYMVMDLLPGGTLEARLREGALDRKWSTDVTLKMAEALDYAHARGVIHRDIKPSNILLDADGAPVLADFGIAKLVRNESDPNLTAAGMVMGTPAYMAPEQLTGQAPDARSDIYSLGVVLYQLLTGHAPFTGDTTAVISGHLTRQPQPPRERVPDLPPALDAVVLQALAKQPEHRFRSAGVFAQALRSAADDLEPGLVRVASAARAAAMPSFSGVALPPASITPGSAAPLTAGQQVAKYLPIALGALGLLLVISLILKYWLLVTLLAMLIGGGGFLFLYLRANAQGRQAARATTRAIATSSALPVSPSAPEPESQGAMATGELPRPTQPLDQADDVPEVPLPDDALVLGANTQSVADDLAPTLAVTSDTSDLLPTEAVGTATAPAEPIVDSPAQDLAPTEAVPVDTADPQAPTEALPAAKDLPPADVTPAAPGAETDTPVQSPQASED
jgi:serine/threonine-protein kinase